MPSSFGGQLHTVIVTVITCTLRCKFCKLKNNFAITTMSVALVQIHYTSITCCLNKLLNYLHPYLHPHVAITKPITNRPSSCNSLSSQYSSDDAEDNECQCYHANDSSRVDAKLAGIQL